jgi:hypothetical protein
VLENIQESQRMFILEIWVVTIVQGDVACDMFYIILVIASFYNKVEYFVKMNFSGLVIAKTYLDSNYVVSI